VENKNNINYKNLVDIASFSPKSVEFPYPWIGHIPFMCWFLKELKPKIFVELGTHLGNSYFSACQLVKESKLKTKCFAVDTWEGDEQSGYYGNQVFEQVSSNNIANYQEFSKLIRMKFDDAVLHFKDQSIDLLHIDGLHTYEAVHHDFTTWLPKMSTDGFIIFHDTKVTERGFGVWKLWSELIKLYPNNFEFDHSYGLGVIGLGRHCNIESLYNFFSEKEKFKNYFSVLGESIKNRYELNKFKQDAILRDQALIERDQALIIRDAQIQTLENQLKLMNNSRSWKITKPLRFLVKCLRSLKTSKELRDLNSTVEPVATNVNINDELIHSSASFDALSGLAPSTKPRDLKEDTATLIAFYLPQYHIIPENSEWWGPGFTEWTNVVKGRPNFDGHYQPHLPRELGFYDLSNIDIIRKQAEMAKLYGVGAFCFYYYWFSGRRILEAPVDNFLHSDIDMPYCLCWANENWTRTWDGNSQGVLLEQKYLESDPQEFIESALPYFADSRYLKVDGKPMLVVYRAKDIPSTEKVFRIWRKAVHAAGFPDLHIVVVDFYDIARPDEVGADALVEFPPHKFNGPEIAPDKLPSIINKEFCGGIIDYAKIIAKSANRPVPDFTLYRGIMPSWDNTARRQNNPTIAYGSSPELFEYWLKYVRAYTREVISDRPDNFIFINAWNEWGEGCHLEPDQDFGLKYLDAVKSSSYFDGSLAGSDKARDVLITAASASIQMRHGYPKESTLEIEQRLRSTLKPIPRAQKISYKLRKYPIVHFVGKCIYKIYRAIWFR
jgi:hypothetical protein